MTEQELAQKVMGYLEHGSFRDGLSDALDGKHHDVHVEVDEW